MNRKSLPSAVCTLLLAASAAIAQQPAPPSQTAVDSHGFNPERGGRGMMGHEEGGMGIVPPGMWWKNPGMIANLGLTPDQQKRMDDIFRESRIELIHLHATLEEEQLNLEPLLSSNPPDQAKTLAEISRIADLRAGLEKANAKMLLGLRGVLTADQWTKLNAIPHRHGEGMRDEGQHTPGPRGAGEGRTAGPTGPPTEEE